MRKLFILIFPFLLTSIFFLTSCNTTSQPDAGNTGATGNTATPEGQERDASYNSDPNRMSEGADTANLNGRGNQLYKPGPTEDDYNVEYDDNKTTREYNENTKSNGVREPNEYPSGRTGGQYSNPKTTTTPSGINSDQSPGTGTPSKSE